MTSVQLKKYTVFGRSARVYEGGTGSPLLLLQGGFGGARVYFFRVWEQLATGYRVIAPDLPGLAKIDESPLPSVSEYVTWLLKLFDILGIESAFCVGNSFGASVAWSLAGRAPQRCSGLVLVNGFPMPKTPPLLRWIGRTAFGKALIRAILRKTVFHPGALKRAFFDSRFVPPELNEMWTRMSFRSVSNFAEVLVAGDGPPNPRVEPLLLWGAEDRLKGTGVADSHKLLASIPGSRLHLIRNAGHCPQLEAPDEFVIQLLEFSR